MNPKLSAKERALIKGALRRIFSRSDLRRAALETVIVPFNSVPEEVRKARNRVKTWAMCPVCDQYCAKSDIEVDHVTPVVPLNETQHDFLERVSIDELVGAIWCDASNLKPMCESCHLLKSNAERKLRPKPKRKKKVDGKL